MQSHINYPEVFAVVIAFLMACGLGAYLLDRWIHPTDEGHATLFGPQLRLQNVRTGKVIVIQADREGDRVLQTVTVWWEGNERSAETFTRPVAANPFRMPSLAEASAPKAALIRRSLQTTSESLTRGPVKAYHYGGLKLEISPLSVEAKFPKSAWKEVR